jgi:hypothetical protein
MSFCYRHFISKITIHLQETNLSTEKNKLQQVFVPKKCHPEESGRPLTIACHMKKF